MSAEFPVDFVVIFGLAKELGAFLEYVDGYEKFTSHGVWFRTSIKSKHHGRSYKICAMSLAEMGNYEAAAATTRAIDVWNPRFIILGGIAGGIKQEDFRLGDLVVAEDIIAYEPGKERNAGIERRFRTLRSSFDLIALAKSLPRETWAMGVKTLRPNDAAAREFPKVHFGTVLSGEKVISSDHWVDGIRADLGTASSRLAAVEMEGYGVGLSSFRAETAPGMLLAKAVCDWADSRKNDEWQEYAAHVSAAFISALISSAQFQPAAGSKLAIRVQQREYHRKSKINLCKRLGNDWEDLADWFDIDPDRRRRFRAGKECQDIWEYLENRQRLGALAEALAGIEREDLIDELVPLDSAQ